MSPETLQRLRKVLPVPVRETLRTIRNWNWNDFGAATAMVRQKTPGVPLGTKLHLVKQMHLASLNLHSPHTQEEMLGVIRAILALTPEVPGCVVEAGCYLGSSTSKFSLAAKAMDRRFVVFDSFEGIPENHELHNDKSVAADTPTFPEGAYAGALEVVTANVKRFGTLEPCEFVKGWFDDTMPGFSEPIAVAYIDVDLVTSTQTCLKHLYPLLQPGGTLFSQDGHLPLVLEVFDDDRFWEEEVGYPKPTVHGFGEKKLIHVTKPLDAAAVAG